MHGPVLGTWIAALLTIFALSFLYKDNPLFRFTESLFAGVSLGYYIGTTLNQTFVPNLIMPLTHDFANNWDLLVPGLLGVLLYMRYLPKGGWIARYALAIFVAYYIGLDFTRRLHGEVLPQLARLIVPLSKFDSHTILYSLVFAVGVLSVLVYFFFSKEQDPVTKRWPAWDLLPHGLLRCRLRLHRHGPGRAPDRPPQLPHPGLDLSPDRHPVGTPRGRARAEAPGSRPALALPPRLPRCGHAHHPAHRLPVTTTGPTRSAYEFVEALPLGASSSSPRLRALVGSGE